MAVEPEQRRITTSQDNTPQYNLPLLPEEVADLVDSGELVPLDPLADPVRISGRNTTPGIRTASTEKNRGIRTAKTSGITTAHPDTSGIETVKPIRTVKPE